jgi:ADP-ribosylglycohydrolase
MLLCLAEALIEGGGADQAARLYLRWWREGHRSARGEVFDIGNATRAALQRIEEGTPAEHAGGDTEFDNGNGSLMRTLPVALWYRQGSPAEVAEHAMRHSFATHRHPRSQLACAFLCLVGRALVSGQSPHEAWRGTFPEFLNLLKAQPSEQSVFARLLDDEFPRTHRDDIRSDGYVVSTLEAAMWCLLQGGSYEDIVLRAINLGGDTDTTGCVAGGLAGVWLGADSIPPDWKAVLPRAGEVETLVGRFVSAQDQVTRSAS